MNFEVLIENGLLLEIKIFDADVFWKIVIPLLEKYNLVYAG